VTVRGYDAMRATLTHEGAEEDPKITAAAAESSCTSTWFRGIARPLCVSTPGHAYFKCAAHALDATQQPAKQSWGTQRPSPPIDIHQQQPFARRVVASFGCSARGRSAARAYPVVVTSCPPGSGSNWPALGAADGPIGGQSSDAQSGPANQRLRESLPPVRWCFPAANLPTSSSISRPRPRARRAATADCSEKACWGLAATAHTWEERKGALQRCAKY
jgi:hypothetical protein